MDVIEIQKVISDNFKELNTLLDSLDNRIPKDIKVRFQMLCVDIISKVSRGEEIDISLSTNQLYFMDGYLFGCGVVNEKCIIPTIEELTPDWE